MKKIKSIVTVDRKSSLCLFEDGSQSWVSNTIAKVGAEVAQTECISIGEMQKVSDQRRAATFITLLNSKDEKVAANAMAELLKAGYKMKQIWDLYIGRCK